ncbi:hypothetical protein DICSQDRAFT_152531 [Dichomitus squalens LYAD-421 SS1]|uniref:uncharacterized protein n=1 Tax=Dichomitus squalens (strain LYAD-421) TaxID=732165 RepID=UPI000441404D|nr:uncharacterized protein DICSQDRAFT_152531 [Dichomitus squalens LYAD-421 SS1]EJF65300.1 hypothetical protein DICSQDRAFT_152531 [Dichomitus squalens LYAD-421 SS1]
MAQTTPHTLQRIYRTALYEVLLHQKTMFILLHEDTTDAAPGMQPLQTDPTPDANGEVNYYEEVETGTKIDKLWRSKLGKFLYDTVVKAELAQEGVQLPTPPDQILLSSLPEHYVLWTHKKGDLHTPRTDHYLHGSVYVDRFRSPTEFLPHLKWLLDGQPMKANGKRDCKCCYCDGSRPQGEISKDLGAYHKRGRGGGKGGRGDRGGRSKPRSSVPEAVPYKDYRVF